MYVRGVRPLSDPYLFFFFISIPKESVLSSFFLLPLGVGSFNSTTVYFFTQ